MVRRPASRSAGAILDDARRRLSTYKVISAESLSRMPEHYELRGRCRASVLRCDGLVGALPRWRRRHRVDAGIGRRLALRHRFCEPRIRPSSIATALVAFRSRGSMADSRRSITHQLASVPRLYPEISGAQKAGQSHKLLISLRELRLGKPNLDPSWRSERRLSPLAMTRSDGLARHSPIW